MLGSKSIKSKIEVKVFVIFVELQMLFMLFPHFEEKRFYINLKSDKRFYLVRELSVNKSLKNFTILLVYPIEKMFSIYYLLKFTSKYFI
jgi:hypothetical protein